VTHWQDDPEFTEWWTTWAETRRVMMSGDHIQYMYEAWLAGKEKATKVLVANDIHTVNM
jgi:hypothetical protein